MARHDITGIGSTEREPQQATPLAEPIDISAEATIDVPRDVLEEALACGAIDEDATVTDLECWLVNNTSYSLGVTVDGEPLGEILEGLNE